MTTALRRSARLFVAAAVPLVFVGATPFADGMSYEFVMKSTSKATGNKEQVTMRGRGTYAGDDAKLEILEASSSAGGKDQYGGSGSYFIVKDGGQVMYMVSPKDKQYMKWDMAAMLAGMSKVVNAVGGLVKMQMSDIKIDAQDMGTETVQGYPTKHIRMVQNYTVSASMFGHKSTSRSETTTDYYFANTMRIANPFAANSQQMAMMSQFDMFNNPDYKTQMNAAMAKMPKNGAPLKMVSTTVTTDEKGKQENSSMTMEMVNFKASNIPASAFEIPAGYTEIQMPTMAGAMAENNGSGNGQAQAAQDTTKKPSVKDEAKKKLKGIFKH